MNELESN